MSVVTIEPGVDGGRGRGRTSRIGGSGSAGGSGWDDGGTARELGAAAGRHPAVRARRARDLDTSPAPARPVLRLVPPLEPAVAGARTTGTAGTVGWRLTRRGRALLLGLVVALCAALAVGLGAARAGASGPAGLGGSGGAAVPSRTTVVTVTAGDTLWSIAADTAPGADRRAVVDRITALNHLGDRSITPGQRLLVPTR